MKNTGSSSSTLTCSSFSRISANRARVSSLGMTTPNRKAPKIWWMPIQLVM